MVWADADPSARFENAVAPSRGSILERASGAQFRVLLAEQPPGELETWVSLERINMIYEGLRSPRLYRTSRRKDAWLGIKDVAPRIDVVLEREDSVRGADFGRVRRVLCARTPAAALPAVPAVGSVLSVNTDTGDQVFRIYAIEPIYSDGEVRFVLERG